MQFSLASASPAAILAFAVQALEEREPKLTRKDLAGEVGIKHLSNLTRYLKCQRTPSPEIAERLARRLNVPVEIFGLKANQADESSSTSNSSEN
jgi:transcriptional regulator with XRE-family HTH domain